MVAPSRPVASATALLGSDSGVSEGDTGKAAGFGDPHDTAAVDYAILVTVDALAPRYLQPLIAAGKLPTFKSLQSFGVWTHNARTDYGYTVTLPNHASVFTGRPVSASPAVAGAASHGYISNSQPGGDATLHNSGNPALAYVQGIFDVAHDAGLRTCFFGGKDKFAVFTRSWGDRFGAPDLDGEDNGRGKLDVAVISHENTPSLIGAYLDTQAAKPCHLAYLHVGDTDWNGHALGWGSPGWLAVLAQVDAYLGRVVRQIGSDSRLRGHTALVVVGDHGGEGTNHQDAADPNNFTIPFYVAAPGLPRAVDAYEFFEGVRLDPGSRRPAYSEPVQPLRNGDAGPLVLELLGVPAMSGATMGRLGLQRRR